MISRTQLNNFVSNPWTQRGALVVGTALAVSAALGGLFAFLAVSGHIPHDLDFLNKFSVLTQDGGIALMAVGGGSASLLFGALVAVEVMRHHNTVRIKEISVFEPEGETVISETELENNSYPATHGTWAKGTTYAETSNGNVDFSHADPKLGFGFVVDGCGHNNPVMRPVLEEAVVVFINDIRSNIKSFSTLEEAEQFAKEICLRFGQTLLSPKFCNRLLGYHGGPAQSYTFKESTYLPALSFGLITQVEGRQYLVTAQYADCFFVIKKAQGGKFEFIDNSQGPTRCSGVGSKEHCGYGNFLPPTIRVTEVEGDDEIYVFSDGIGEFLTREEVGEALSGEVLTNPLEILCQKMTSVPTADGLTDGNRINLVWKEGDGEKTKYLVSANGQRTKILDKSGKEKSMIDDTCYAYLKVRKLPGSVPQHPLQVD